MTYGQYITLEEVLDQIEQPITNFSTTVTPIKGFEDIYISKKIIFDLDANHVCTSTDTPSTSSSVTTYSNVDGATIVDPVMADFQGENGSVYSDNDDCFFSSSAEGVSDNTHSIVIGLSENDKVDKEASTNLKPHIGNKEHACCYCNKVM